jgi:hypothetical protein
MASGAVVKRRHDERAAGGDLGFGRIFVSENEAPILL